MIRAAFATAAIYLIANAIIAGLTAVSTGEVVFQ